MEDITSKLDNILTTATKPPNSGKPPNIVVYSECQSSAVCIKETLSLVLEKQRYTVYILNAIQMLTAPWLNNVCLLVIAGDVSPDITNRLKSYVMEGNGRLFCIGSNVLDAFVPEFASADVNDVMGLFTYSKWERVELLHRVLKYQSSKQTLENALDSIFDHLPNKNSLPNSKNELTNFDVIIFGQEENSLTPSFILLTSNTGGKTLFSNVHLEIDFTNAQLKQNYRNSSEKCNDLSKNCSDLSTNYSDSFKNCEQSKKNSYSSKNYSDLSENYKGSFKNYNEIRIDIFADLLQKHFGLSCGGERNIEPDYSFGYLFGDLACKRKFLKDLESRLTSDGVLKLKKISVKFCEGEAVDIPSPSPMLLPVLVDDEGACSDFSVGLFFDELRTKRLGRIGVFTKVMTSSMYVIDTRLLSDGFIVVPQSLTRGVGRGENVWLSPEGCALFSLQIQVTAESQFIGRLGFLQHCVTLAAVLCVRALPGCQELALNLKWPNDVYADKTLKIGGAIASSIVSCRDAVCNLGVGVNLFNRLPTTCINDMIDALNARNGTRVQHLTLEKFVAILLNQFEQLIDMVESGRISEVIELYYKHWLHSGSKVSVRTEDGRERQVTIVGIDNSGFLKVVDKDNRQFSVHPDGNSFDMLSGLIAPKVL